MKSCAIVILNWNTKDYLRRFLPGVLATSEALADVIVADNGSSDGSVDALKEEFPEVRRIEFDKNYGFTGGYNRALGQLEGYEYFLLLNSDIETPEGWLKPLVEWMDGHQGCGACAPKLHSLQDRDSFEYAGAAGGYLDLYGYPFCRGRVLRRVEKDNGQYDDASPYVFWASGACLMVRSSLWKAMGGLDERFFAHMEEIDFCWRLALAGYSVCVVPSSTVYHLGGGTLPAASPFKLLLNHRNNLLMCHKNLAQTLAVRYRQKGLKRRKAALKGLRVARVRIFLRMVFDGLESLTYLLRGRFSLFKSVFNAHKEYCRLKGRMASRKSIEEALRESENVRIVGFYKGMILPHALLRGDGIFSYVRQILP